MPRPNWDETNFVDVGSKIPDIDAFQETDDAKKTDDITGISKIPDENSFKKEKLSEIAFDYPSSTGNIQYSTNDINSLISKIKNIQDYLNSDLIGTYNELTSSLSNINLKTGEKFVEKTNENISVQQEDFKNNIDDRINFVNSIIEFLNDILEKIQAIDEDGLGAAGELPQIPIVGSSGQSSDGNSENSQSSTDTETVEEIVKVPNYDEVMQQYSSIIVATVLFSEIVPLYEVIGDPTSVESVTNTDIYKLIGIQKEEGKYYFKILDSSTGKIYFAEINDKLKVDWDQLGERKVIEVIGDNVFILKKPEAEGDILERIAKTGDIYFLNDDNISVDGIDYYNINDSMTGKNLYIPISDSIAKPDLISNIISTISNGNGVSK